MTRKGANMELTETDLNDLAAFFGRRLDVNLTPTPAPQTRAEERQRAMAWLLTLEEAQEHGKLSALVLRISRKFPDDRNLQEACGILMDPGRSSDRVAGLVFLAAGAVGAAGMLVGAGLIVAAVATGASFSDVASMSRISVEPAMEVVGASEEAMTPNRAVLTAFTGRCTRPDGGRVGYWYAGRRNPGGVGQIATFDRAVNVRVDFPDRHNDFDARSHIECVLQPGDHVRISGEPILVPGGAWWVPLYTGDLETPARTAGIAHRDGHSG
ncbi:MAG: hypothetical protein H6737_10255 [Alphaproteobacteria bacterium]|nr:hypothetical protein [Alphaproteobacteria bacterium]